MRKKQTGGFPIELLLRAAASKGVDELKRSVGGKKKHGGFLLGPIGLPIGLALGPGRQVAERQLEQTMKRKAADMAAAKVRNKIMGIKDKK